MKPFIDIAGASGTLYRFQRIDGPERLPSTAGNFVFLRSDPQGDTIVCCGTARSLVLAAPAWKSAVEQHQASDIFVRLNVSRTVRTAEHEDIVERQTPILAILDPG